MPRTLLCRSTTLPTNSSVALSWSTTKPGWLRKKSKRKSKVSCCPAAVRAAKPKDFLETDRLDVNTERSVNSRTHRFSSDKKHDSEKSEPTQAHRRRCAS